MGFDSPRNCGFYNDGSKPNKCLPCLKSSADDEVGELFLRNCVAGVSTGKSDVRCGEGFFIKTDGSCEECKNCREGERLNSGANSVNRNCFVFFFLLISIT